MKGPIEAIRNNKIRNSTDFGNCRATIRIVLEVVTVIVGAGDGNAPNTQRR
jgi:hypothetical protein